MKMSNMEDFKNAGPIDMESVLERVGGDISFLQELLDIYVEDFFEKYPRLKQAISQNDFNSIRDIGHSIKGSSGNLSLNGLYETAYGIELSGRNKDIEQAKMLFSRLKDEFKRLKEFLPREKQQNIEQKMPNLD